MRRATKIGIGAGAVVLALAVFALVFGPTIYRDVLSPPPAETPVLTADEGALNAGSGQPLAREEVSGDWLVSEGSEAGYRVDEVLNGTEVTVTGRTTEVSGWITLDGFTATDAEFTVEVSAITTDSAPRDAYFRDTALRTEDHPTATFRMTQPVEASSPRRGEAVPAEIRGELTIAGVTQPVVFDAQVRTDGSVAEVAGRVPIEFADFSVTAPDLGFVTVEPKGFVEFDLRLTRDPAG